MSHVTGVIAGALCGTRGRHDPVPGARRYVVPGRRRRRPAQLAHLAGAHQRARPPPQRRPAGRRSGAGVARLAAGAPPPQAAAAAAVADVAASDGAAAGERHRHAAEPALRRRHRSLHLLTSYTSSCTSGGGTAPPVLEVGTRAVSLRRSSSYHSTDAGRNLSSGAGSYTIDICCPRPGCGKWRTSIESR